MCENTFEIRQLPLSVGRIRQRVEVFLQRNGLRLEAVDYYAGLFTADGDELVAGGGLQGGLLKCIAVAPEWRASHVGLRIISHLLSTAQAMGHSEVRVFTKPDNREKFQQMGFRELAATGEVVLMENGNGLSRYLQTLQDRRQAGRNGIIVMNGNPFTIGHRYLIEQAAAQVDRLYLMPVGEDVSLFSTAERTSMMRAACADLPQVSVLEGSPYSISRVTFPTYFLKKIASATQQQMEIDLQLFARYIAPALGVTVRFVGSEPEDELTRLYNQTMQRLLPAAGISVVEVDRLQKEGRPVSASALRRAMNTSFHEAAALAHPVAIPYILGVLATNALQKELDTPLKPGLVCPQDVGSHADMNYELMKRSLRSLRPYFVHLALMGTKNEAIDTADIRRIGLDAEATMLKATGGVNTHRGALFALGLTIIAAAQTYQLEGAIRKDALQQRIIALARPFSSPKDTHGGRVRASYGVKGALQMAQEGYAPLFDDWLPALQRLRDDPYSAQKTLLRIMQTLDDTNVYHRCGPAAAAWIKQRAAEVYEQFSIDNLQKFCNKTKQKQLSPGGSADMLALTMLVNTLTNP